MPGLFKHPYARYQREAIGVSLRKTPFIQAMQYPEAFGFSSVYPLGFAPCAGFRVGVLRWFQAFLASSAFTVSANSYQFESIAPPPWRSVFSWFALAVKLGFPILVSGSHCAVKPTRIRRAAYFWRRNARLGGFTRRARHWDSDSLLYRASFPVCLLRAELRGGQSGCRGPSRRCVESFALASDVGFASGTGGSRMSGCSGVSLSMNRLIFQLLLRQFWCVNAE